MKVMKRTLCLVLALVMLVGMFTVGVSAEANVPTGLTVSYDENVTLIEGSGSVNVTLAFEGGTDCYADIVFHHGNFMAGYYAPARVAVSSSVNITVPVDSTFNGKTIQCTVWYHTSPSKVEHEEAIGWGGAAGSKQLVVSEAKKYSIKFMDGENVLSNLSAYEGEAIPVPSSNPTKDGYTFKGWADNANAQSGVMTPAGEVKEDMIFYAIWEKDASTTVPPTSLNPTPAIPRFLKNAVVVSCASDHHDTLTLDIEKLSADAQITMNEAKDTATIRLSDEDYSAIVAAYNDATDAKHSYTNKLGTAIVLKYKEPCFPFFKGGWYVDTKAEMEVACDCDHCHDYCGGWFHKHTVTYNDGVKGDVIFKDITYTVKHGAKTPVPAAPVRVGYKFAGWTPAVSSTATKCVTYYATWVDAKGPALTKEHVAYLKGYGAGLVKPEGEITRAEAITMLYRLMDKASVKEYYTTYNAFSDVAKDAWYNDAVSTLANAGVLRYKTGLLNPNEAITRAEFFYMLTKFSNVEYTGKCTFVDVPSTYWAYEELTLAQYLGWIKGYGGGVLYPDDTITRAEVAASLNRVLGRTACKVKDTKNFIDNPVNAWYYDDIVEASIAH